MLVLTVGVNTVENHLKSILQKDDDKTPLQEKLEVLADQIGKIGMGAALILLLALCFHLVVDSLRLGHPIFSL
jgi:P-type Ca2+ transporter type 2B